MSESKDSVVGEKDQVEEATMSKATKDPPFVEFVQREVPEGQPAPKTDDYIARFGRNARDESDVDFCISEIAKILAKGRPFFILYDASAVTSAKKAHLETLAKFLASNSKVTKKLTLGVSVVIPDLIVRGTVKLVLFAKPAPYPTKVFEDVTKAKNWLVAHSKNVLKKLA